MVYKYEAINRIIIIISESVQNLKGVWVHNTNTKVQGAKLQSVVCEIT